MAKRSGLGANLYLGVNDFSGDVGAISTIETMRTDEDVTGIDKSAMERLLLLRDGTIAFASFWNVAAGQAEAVLSTAPTADIISSVWLSSTLGDVAASMTAKQMNYAIARGQDGSLGATTDLKANGFGLEWGESLTTGKQSFSTGTVAGTGIDYGAVSTAFGAAAYLHVFSVASGTATFKVQDSDDDMTYADVTGLTFTGATGATTQRLQTATNATIRQYVRVQGSGTHGAAVIAVNFVRYLEDPSV